MSAIDKFSERFPNIRLFSYGEGSNYYELDYGDDKDGRDRFNLLDIYTKEDCQLLLDFINEAKELSAKFRIQENPCQS